MDVVDGVELDRRGAAQFQTKRPKTKVDGSKPAEREKGGK